MDQNLFGLSGEIVLSCILTSKMDAIDQIKERLLKAKDDHLMAIQEIDRDLAAFERLKKYQVNDSGSLPLKSAVVTVRPKSDQYPRTKSYEDKCLFLINELNTGFVTDVAERMIEYEPKLDPEKAQKIATYYLSKLQREEKITFERVGKKYKYISLPL